MSSRALQTYIPTWHLQPLNFGIGDGGGGGGGEW